MATVAAVAAASSWGALPAVAQEDSPSLADFDRSGLEVEALALFEAGGATTLYSAADSRWGAAGSLVEGDVEFDEDTRIVRVMLPERDGSLLRLNDDGGVAMERYFGRSGAGEDLTVWIQTGSATESFPANDVRTAGNHYVNFNVPPSGRAVLSGIGPGDRFILALTRPAPTPEPTPEPTATSTSTTGEQVATSTPATTTEPVSTPIPAPAAATTTEAAHTPSTSPTASTTTVVDVNARELLWSHTMTVRELNTRYPVFYKGEAYRVSSVPASWRITLPDGSIARVVASASLSLGSGGPFFWTVNSNGSSLHEYALELEVGDRVLSIGDAIIVEGGHIGIPYSWPTGGQDWSEGDVVELKLYHYPNREAAPSLPRVHRPGRIPSVALAPAEAGGLVVSWEAPPNAAEAEVLEYHVFLKREADDWSEAQEQVSTAKGQTGDQLSLSYFGLEAGVEYRASVYARNIAAYGTVNYSAPVAAPEQERPPAALSSLSVSGTTGLEFDPNERRYLVQVEPGVTETTIDHQPSEEGATSTVTVVRTDGALEADTEDANPDTGGHQARLSSDGDTTALVIVTSADGLRQDGYGMTLRQRAGGLEDDQGSDIVKRSTTKSETAALSNWFAGNSGWQPPPSQSRSSVVRPVPVNWEISYGDQTAELADSGYYRTATVSHEVSQITLAPTEPFNGGLLIRPRDANSGQDGHQVNLRGSHPGGGPAETVVAVFFIRTDQDYAYSSYFLIKVFRSPPTRNDATLDSLEVTGAELFPSFLYDFQEYTAAASHDTATATIEAVSNQPDATVDFEPTTAGSTSEPYQRTLSEGDNPVAITVTAPNGTTTKTYTVTINRAMLPSSDATLGRLEVAGATISPAFQSSVTSYSSTVRSHVSLITLELETSDDGASIDVTPGDANGEAEGWQIPVDVGTSTVAIAVTAENGTSTKSYTLTVNRNSLEMESAPLGSLSVEGATVYPEFSEDVLSYTAVVGNEQAQVTVSASGKNMGSTVAVDPADADAETEDHEVALEEGRNVIAITVTAMDATTTREYELTVFRTPGAATTTGFLQVDAGWWNYCGLRVDHTISCSIYGGYNSISEHVPDGIFERISVHRIFGCGLRADGSEVCWNGAGRTFSRTGLMVGDFSMSPEHGAEICALEEDGDLRCRKLLDNSIYYAPPDVTVSGPFQAIGQNRFGACAIRLDGKVRCWAYGRDGLIPIDLPNEYRDTKFKFISGGYAQACGIRESDNAALCWKWRYNPNQFHVENADNSALYAPPGEYSFIDTSISYGPSCGVKTDGTVDCWYKEGISSRVSSPPGETDIGYKSVTVEWEQFICGLRNDNQLICWNWAGRVIDNLADDSPWRSNSQLLGVDLGGTPLHPGFDRDVLSYSASVPQETGLVTVKPALTNSLAVYSVYSDRTGAAGDDGVVTLEEGDNIINIHVVSADRTASSTYSIAVDTTDARVERVDVTSTSTGGVYGVGDVIEVTVGFTNPVTATGTPGFIIGTGAGPRTAAYASGSGTRSLVFRYTVVAGDRDADGIWIGHHGPRPGRPGDVGVSWSVDASNSLKAPDNSDANLDFFQRRVHKGHRIDTD